MSAFDADYQPLYEMYDDEYFPDFLVDKIKAELDKVETVLAGGEKNTAAIQQHFDTMTRAINDLEAEFEENDSESKPSPANPSAKPSITSCKNTALILTLKKPSANASGKRAKNPALLRDFLYACPELNDYSALSCPMPLHTPRALTCM
jgi:hypothetical protein